MKNIRSYLCPFTWEFRILFLISLLLRCHLRIALIFGFVVKSATKLTHNIDDLSRGSSNMSPFLPERVTSSVLSVIIYTIFVKWHNNLSSYLHPIYFIFFILTYFFYNFNIFNYIFLLCKLQCKLSVYLFFFLLYN